MAQLALGLMSGTSCDGVSAALVRIDGRIVRLIAERTVRYPPRLARSLRGASRCSTPTLSALNMELGERLADAALALLKRAKISPRRIAVVGSHGHTIYHGPSGAIPSTFQLGAPAMIAQRTGLPVVADFRPRDIAAGGEGAPLVPYFDKYFFGHSVVRALQNLGGIANVTIVGRSVRTLAFDTGPGNVLIDLITQQITRGRQRYDHGGRLAQRGRIDHRAIRRLWSDPYFRRPPPKSTGPERFNASWLRAMFGARLTRRPLDVLATVTYFTAYSIAESYRGFVPMPIREVIVSGGGARNRTVMRHLAQLLQPIPVRSMAQYGIPVQAKEPAAFAFLALRALQGRVNHLPTTTGAKRACVLGALTLA